MLIFLGLMYIYKQGDYSVSSAMFDNLRNIFGGRKMLTMSENGTLPDPDMMKQMDAKRLYVCTWVGDFIFDGRIIQQITSTVFSVITKLQPSTSYPLTGPDTQGMLK
jgi:hypothetical protein